MTSIAAPEAPTACAEAPLRFANAGGVLLERLVAGIKGSMLRRELTEATAALEASGATIAVRDAELLVNDEALSSHAATVWHEQLERAGLASVSFARATSERELLLFAAILVAPGERGAFKRLWLECGAWRIHVTCVGDGETPVPPFTKSSTVGVPDGLRELCAAVGRDSMDTSFALLEELKRHGAAATAELLEQLAIATQGSRRRYLFEAILAIREGDEHLVAALEHPDWFVARNAAALLGELRATHADLPLILMLDHADARVRAAAAISLGQLDTPVAREALLRAVHDSDERVRARAWEAWTMCADAPPLELLDTALRHDDTPLVKRAMLDCASAFPMLDVGGGLVRFCAREFTNSDQQLLMAYGVEQLARRRPSSATAFVRRMPELFARG